MASLRPHNTEAEIVRKIRVVGADLDILIARRIWNFRAIDYSTMQYSMFIVMRDIRGKTPDELVTILGKRLDDEEETFVSNEHLRLHGTNGRQIHYLLARMADYVETRSGMASRYLEYIVRGGKHAYEIEHIWPNHPEQHTKDFEHPSAFIQFQTPLRRLLPLPTT